VRVAMSLVSPMVGVLEVRVSMRTGVRMLVGGRPVPVNVARQGFVGQTRSRQTS
jgi:hypothetical protein